MTGCLFKKWEAWPPAGRSRQGRRQRRWAPERGPARPCLIRSQVKLCGSWPVTPCTIVHNAISISPTPKINQTLNSFKCYCGKTLSLFLSRGRSIWLYDLITQNSIQISERSTLFLILKSSRLSYLIVLLQYTERPNLCHLVTQQKIKWRGWMENVLRSKCSMWILQFSLT